MPVNPAQAMTQVTGYQGDAGLGQSQQWGFGFVGQALAGINRRAQEKQLLEMQLAQQNEQQAAQQQAQQQQAQQQEQFLQGIFTNIDQFTTEQDLAPHRFIPKLGYLADDTVDPETGRPKNFPRFAREMRDMGMSDDQIEDAYVWARSPQKIQMANQNAVAGTVLRAGGMGVDNEVMKGLDQAIGHLPVDADEAGSGFLEQWETRTEGLKGAHVFKELSEAGITQSIVTTYGADPTTIQNFMPAIQAIKDQPPAAVDRSLGIMFGQPIQKRQELGPERIPVTPGTRTLPIKTPDEVHSIGGNLDLSQLMPPEKLNQFMMAKSGIKRVEITTDETGEMFVSLPDTPGFEFLSQIPLSAEMDAQSFQDLQAGTGRAATGGTITGRQRGVAPAQAVTAPGGPPVVPQPPVDNVIPPPNIFIDQFAGPASRSLQAHEAARLQEFRGTEYARRQREFDEPLMESTRRATEGAAKRYLETLESRGAGPSTPLDPDVPEWLRGIQPLTPEEYLKKYGGA